MGKEFLVFNRIALLTLSIYICNGANILRDHFQHTHPRVFDSAIIRNHFEKTSEYYLEMGKAFVQKQLEKKNNLNTNIAKNVVFFLGDGMSISTLSATRMYMGGEEKSLSFEKFPFVGMSKTYCTDFQVADSACTSTAYLSGVKANYGTLGVNAKVKRGSCIAANDTAAHTQSIAKWAIDAGKSVGFVTTTRVTHASPAGLYAHSADRDWECNRDVIEANCDDDLVDDIAEQLIHSEVGSKFKVIFGGGRAEFHQQNVRDEEGNYGHRTDGKNLIQEWLNYDKTSDRRAYVWNKTELLMQTADNTDAVLGLFAKSHCKFNYEIDGISDTMPTLSEMTMKAIEILSTNENGFFLFVEGGRIDHAHHDTLAHIALDETVEFAKAVELAKDQLNDDNSLLLVTADHSHTMTFAGYGARGSNVFGVGGRSDSDQIPYLKLNYANGHGYFMHKNETSKTRIDPSVLRINGNEFEFPGTVPRVSETHAGEDVAVFATGPYSHLFRGNFDQHTIPYVLAYASCIGDGETACKNKT